MQVWCACADTWSCGSHAHAVRPVADRMLNPGSVGAPGPSGSARPGLCWRGFPMSKQPRNLNAVSGRLQRRMLVAQLSTGTVGNASEPARWTVPVTPPEPPSRLPVHRASVRSSSEPASCRGGGWCQSTGRGPAVLRIGARRRRIGRPSRTTSPAEWGAWRVRPRRARGRDAPSHPRPLNAHTRPKVDGRAVIGTQRPSEPARSCSSEGCSVPERTRVASFATRSPTQKGRLTRTVSRRAGRPGLRDRQGLGDGSRRLSRRTATGC